ncbi:tetratricopeptide repeat protein [Corallococcus sicarius]|uniref:Tetratricopeptide repeat protein n=1 Tax=Corallococcus sicarius TaxID=2316726 RepID=A0A3A8N8X7_9BACT|nr:tetratricopeptide repeat protein [Corallococcus sicarius]RKH39910.1 tetratricopeptide repeat protein [Corallococcus sicarius]
MPDAEGAVPPEVEAKAMMDRARALIRSGHLDEVIPLCDEVYRRFTTSRVPALQVQVARALGNRGAVMAEQHPDRIGEALVHFEEVERRFWSAKQPLLWEVVAWAMVHRARVVLEQDRPDLGIAGLGAVLRRFGALEKQHGLHAPVSMARELLVVAYNQAQQYEEALRLSDELLTMFDGSDDPLHVEHTAAALQQKGEALRGLGRKDEALGQFDEVDVRYCQHTDPRMRALVTGALMSRALLLLREERVLESISAMDAILEHVGPTPDPRLLEASLFAKFHKELLEQQVQEEREQAARKLKAKAKPKRPQP